MIAQTLDFFISGPKGTNHFSVLFLIITLIMVPLQCIAEEYAFRGLFMQSLGSWFNIPILAIVSLSISFVKISTNPDGKKNNLGFREMT